MPYLAYQSHKLHSDGICLAYLVQSYATPCYIYSYQTILDNLSSYSSSLHARKHLLCYAVKANNNLSLLNSIANQGAGFDVVSGGELDKVLAAGGRANLVAFSGVGKTTIEIEHALSAGIFCFNVESLAELNRISVIAVKNNTIAPVALRINPEIDAQTHPYISTGLGEHKFGIAYNQIIPIYKHAAALSGINLIGIACHIGSQITQLDPFIAAVQCLLDLIKQLKEININLKHLDIGGGLGVSYDGEATLSIQDYVRAIDKTLATSEIELILAPGRSIVANAGVLLTAVEYIKEHNKHNFAVIDAAMNDLLRPCLYGSEHRIVPLIQRDDLAVKNYDIVGPICESSDVFRKNYSLAIKEGDILAILDTGAYGSSMGSNYNSRCHSAEVMLHKGKDYLVRKRQEVADLWRDESIMKV